MLEPITFEFLESLGFSIGPSSRFAYLGNITVENFYGTMKLVPSRQHIPFLIENKLHFLYLLEKRGFPIDQLRKEALLSLQPKIEYQKNRLEKALNVLGFEKTVQSDCGGDSILFLREPFYQRKFIQVVQKKGFVSYLRAGYIIGFSKISDKDLLTAEDLFEELKYTVKKQSERSFTDLEKMVLYAKIEEKEKQFYSM